MNAALDTTLLQNRLAEEIRRYVDNEAILQAFRKVPRHEFISHTFYNRSEQKNVDKWKEAIFSNEQERLEEIYKNRPLVTSLDSYGKPDSSSSQPNIMAQMIQSLQLHDGARVLEVGTGTGYNAALMACIVGLENVVSIEINKALLDEARARLERTVGPGVTLVYADGRRLPESLGAFDAIIVTAASKRLEPSWIEALLPGGRLIFNWRPNFVTEMIEVEKTSENTAIGRVAPYDAEFMRLHDGNGVDNTVPPPVALEPIANVEFRPQITRERDFMFFLAINLPATRYDRYQSKKTGERSYAIKDLRKNLVVHFYPGQVRGNASLWEEIHATYEMFEQLGKPNPKAFSLVVDESGSMTFSYQNNVFHLQV